MPGRPSEGSGPRSSVGSADAAHDGSPGTRYGVDIGGTSTEVVRLDRDGVVDAHGVTPTRHGQDLIEGTLEALHAVSLGSPIGSVGIGVPGQVDPRQGIVRHAVNLGLDGSGVPLGRAIARELEVPVHLENDGRAAALGAQRLLAPRSSVVVLLTIGTGVSAGVVIDGRVHRGRDGLAGEIGHVVVDPSGPRCACGLNGCLEVLVSGAALRRRWPNGREGSAAADLYAAAAAGDPAARRVASEVTSHLVVALHWLVTAYGADVVVLAGGVGRVGGPLLAAVHERIDDLGQGSPFAAGLLAPERVLAVPADLPVGAIGAAVLADAGHPAVEDERGSRERQQTVADPEGATTERTG